MRPMGKRVLIKFKMDIKKDIAIVYLVAGISKRFGGKIKQLVKVGPNGESFIEYSLNQALSTGFSKIIFVVGEHTEKLFKERFGEDYKGVSVDYAFQKFDKEKRDRPWGTGDAPCSLIEMGIDCPFVICNGDNIYGNNTLRTLHNHLLESNDAATIGSKLINRVPETGTVNRGIF